LRTSWLYPSSLRSSLPGRTRLPYGLFSETSHVVKSQRQRSIIERTRRPFSFDNKASITEDLDPPALLRRPRFGSKEGAVRHESVGAAHFLVARVQLLAVGLGCFPLSLTQINARPLRPGDTRKRKSGPRPKAPGGGRPRSPSEARAGAGSRLLRPYFVWNGLNEMAGSPSRERLNRGP
jgi:hypothetical protein